MRRDRQEQWAHTFTGSFTKYHEFSHFELQIFIWRNVRGECSVISRHKPVWSLEKLYVLEKTRYTGKTGCIMEKLDILEKLDVLEKLDILKKTGYTGKTGVIRKTIRSGSWYLYTKKKNCMFIF